MRRSLRLVLWFVVLSCFTAGAVQASIRAIQESGKASKPHVGSAMAVLATLAQAQVLPPEQTPEANRIIKSVIQFQSAFAKSRDQAIHDFAAQALSLKYGAQAPVLLAEFQSSGWTAAVLESLAEAEPRTSGEQLQALAAGFGEFNLSTKDFQQFMSLVRAARHSLQARGLTFEQVYAAHRRTMPGAPNEPQGKPSDGQL
jgi:hypothetical protein